MNTLLKTIGGRVARQAASKHIGDGATLDAKRGWAMLRDRSVPAGAKVSALGLGIALTAALVALEVPVEAIVGFFLPMVGVAGDALFDGAELILGPLLFASLAIPFLAPKPVEARVVAGSAVPPRQIGRR